VFEQFGEPRRIGEIGLATRDHLHVLGVHQLEVEVAVLQQIPDRLPVLTGRLHHHLDNTVGRQPGRQFLDPRRERRERAQLRPSTPPSGRRSPHTADNLALADIETGASVDHHIHHTAPFEVPEGAAGAVRSSSL